jgi:Flp pilus assembly protein TadD
MGVLFTVLANVAMAAVDPFYLGLYQRGMTQFEAGDFAGASKELRLAAFGLVESLEQFETAHVYAAIAASKAGRSDEAEVSVRRIVAAERVTRTYAHLALPAPVRAEFETIAKSAVAADAYAFLTSPGAPPPPRSTPRVVVQTPPTAAAPSNPSVSASASADRITSGTDGKSTPSTPSTSSVPPPSIPHSTPASANRAPGTGKTLADADLALATGDLTTARAIYGAQLENSQLSHRDLLRVGEGLCHAGDFSGAVRAFTRAGTLTSGEERSHYYFAVSLYEVKQYRDAKRELQAGLPFVEKTPEVASYQARIERAVE